MSRLHDLTPAEICAAGITPELVAEMLSERSVRVKDERCYWFRAVNEHTDAGTDWCRRCVVREAARLRKAHPEIDPGEFDPDGGFSIEHDSRPHCEKCGARLQGTLTDYGIEMEIEHFAENRDGRICPAVADDLRDIFHAAQCHPKRADDIARIALWAWWTLRHGPKSWAANPENPRIRVRPAGKART